MSAEYITFYVQKYIEHLVTCTGRPAGSRRTAKGARICENHLFLLARNKPLKFCLFLSGG